MSDISTKDEWLREVTQIRQALAWHKQIRDQRAERVRHIEAHAGRARALLELSEGEILEQRMRLQATLDDGKAKGWTEP